MTPHTRTMIHVIARLSTLHSKRHYNVEIKTPITGYHSKIDTVDNYPKATLKPPIHRALVNSSQPLFRLASAPPAG
jgi:hypothetical protein